MFLSATFRIIMLSIDHLVLLNKQILEFEPLLYFLGWRTLIIFFIVIIIAKLEYDH